MDSLFFHMPSRVLFGPGTRLRLGTEARRCGSRALLITESIFRSTPLLQEIREVLSQSGIETIVFAETGPDTTSRAAESCIDLAKSGRVQMIIGLGGVSTLSTAKAVASLGSTIFDIDNRPDYQNPEPSVYPYIEVPTTCRNPFMFSEEFYLVDARNRRSTFIRRRNAFPVVTVIDPEFAADLSERILAATMLDTLLHSLEGYFSSGTTFMSSSIFLRSIGLIVKYIDEFSRRSDPETAIKAYQAGFLSAFALTMGSLGIGSTAAICAGGLFRVPKSGVAAVMLAPILEYGRYACPDKLARIAPILNEDTRNMNNSAAADLVIGALRRRIDSLELPLRLSDYGIGAADLPVLASCAAETGVTDQMPVPTAEEEILELLNSAL